MRTPATGIPASRIAAITSRPPPAEVPTFPAAAGELLEEHLGVEVVALVVHAADRPARAGRRRRRRARSRRRGRDAEPGPAGDRDAAADERLAEGARREQRRRERRPAAGAVDDERRERRRLAADEVRLPAGGPALRVVERLVAEDPPGHRADATAADRRGEAIEIRRRERRVAEALEHEIPVPGRARAGADAVDLGVEAVAGAERASARPTRRGSSRSTPARPGATGCGRRGRHRSSRRRRARRSAPSESDGDVERLRQLRLQRRRPGRRRRRRQRRTRSSRAARRRARRLIDSTVDRDRDGAPPPGERLRGRRHPEIDDVALDRRSDVGGDRRAVAGDEDPGAERDHASGRPRSRRRRREARSPCCRAGGRRRRRRRACGCRWPEREPAPCDGAGAVVAGRRCRRARACSSPGPA